MCASMGQSRRKMFPNTSFLLDFHWKKCLSWLCLVWWRFGQNKVKNFDLKLVHIFAYNSKSVLLQRSSFSHAGTHYRYPLNLFVQLSTMNRMFQLSFYPGANKIQLKSNGYYVVYFVLLVPATMITSLSEMFANSSRYKL